jgi:hypothetical protein
LLFRYRRAEFDPAKIAPEAALPRREPLSQLGQYRRIASDTYRFDLRRPGRLRLQPKKKESVGMGGPLGKTKKVSEHGIEDISNLMSGYTVVRADSHDAAAKLYEKHPHFTVFPGDSVEVMPVLPIPNA